MKPLVRGGFITGLVVGLVLGLGVALAVALYVTKTPVPFIDKLPQRTAEQDAAEADVATTEATEAEAANAEAPKPKAKDAPSRPFIERSLVLAPERVGDLALVAMQDYPGNPAAGVGMAGLARVSPQRVRRSRNACSA